MKIIFRIISEILTYKKCMAFNCKLYNVPMTTIKCSKIYSFEPIYSR